MSIWNRPENVPFPSNWHTFTAKSIDGDKLVKYIVQDLPENRFDEAVKYMIDHFLPDEVIVKCNGAHQDEASLPQFKELWENFVKQKVSLVCFEEGCDEIVALNMCVVNCRGDSELIFETDTKASRIVDSLSYVSKQFNCFEVYGCDKYLSGLGLVVSSKYRGRNISPEILKARFPLCKALGIKVTSTTFTGLASQKAAERAGFTESYSIKYADLEKVNKRYTFPNIENEACKIMSYQIE